MSAYDIGKKLVALCKEGKNMEALNTLYAPNIVSIEATEPSAEDGAKRVTEGIEGVRGKNAWWAENMEVHESNIEGPWPHGDDKFAVRFAFEVTNKPSGQRMKMDEIGVFTVDNGKVVREEFFYSMD